MLKCCAHILLGIDHAIGKSFSRYRNQDSCAEVTGCICWTKSIPLTIYFDPHTSTDCISKVIFSSYASHSVSLFNEYKTWMDVNNTDHRGFKGFTANQFGRFAEIAREFIDRNNRS